VKAPSSPILECDAFLFWHLKALQFVAESLEKRTVFPDMRALSPIFELMFSILKLAGGRNH
jgi:hypothetical protein